MSKSTDSRTTLTAELEAIRTARETEEQNFKAALEKLYADHRKAMKDLAARRQAAWATYGEARKSKPEAETPAPKKAAKKPTKKAAAKKPAKKAPAKVAAVLPDEFANG